MPEERPARLQQLDEGNGVVEVLVQAVASGADPPDRRCWFRVVARQWRENFEPDLRLKVVAAKTQDGNRRTSAVL